MGAYFVSVTLGAIGIVLGIVGYSLGAQNFERATRVIGVVSIFVGLLIGQGVILGSYDETINAITR